MPTGPDPRLPDRVAAHVAAARLFPSPGTALVAVSGGADSLALLYLLADLAPVFRLTVVAGHVDHGIDPQSARWAREADRCAAAVGVPLVIARLALGAPTSETRARRARYSALRRLQRDAGATYLVTAHHADDQVETVLYRLLRGSGPAGLAGIPAVGAGGLVRPLLPFTRGELAAWLAVRAPASRPVVDPANADEAHDRVWLRRTVLPELRRRLPDVERRILGAQRQAELERVAWEALVSSDPDLDARDVRDGVEVARDSLRRYDKALSVALLRALARLTGLRLGLRRAERLVDFARHAPSGRRLDLGECWTAETAFDRLRLVGPRRDRGTDRGGEVPLGFADAGEARWRGWCITWRAERAGSTRRAGLATWVTPGGLALRAVARGERLRPLGGVGRRPVRRLLMEARVPRAERAAYPVVVREHDLVWIPGVCRSDAALPRPGEPALRLDARRIRDP